MSSLIELVQELRQRTGAGMMDCKKALEASEQDIEKAIDWLRQKGIAKAGSKSGRIAAEGVSTVIVDGNKAVIAEINSETDFTAKNERFLHAVKVVAEGLLNGMPRQSRKLRTYRQLKAQFQKFSQPSHSLQAKR